MVLFVLILNLVEFLEDVFAFFVEAGVTGATILDSVGMGRFLTSAPIFAGFREMMVDNRPSNKTVLAVVDRKLVPELLEGLGKILGDLSVPGTGLAFTLPLEDVVGGSKVL